MTQYSMPGMWVREHAVDVPLDWDDHGRGEIEVFVREIVDPDRRGDDLPLITYLQGGPGGANPRPLEPNGWIEEALKHYRVVLVDQRGTGRSTPLDAQAVAELGDAGADHLARFRADSIVRDLEHVRHRLYNGRKWATLAQSYGGWLTLAYLSHAPEAIAAAYVCGGIPGNPMSADEVYRRTFDRVAAKTAEYYRRYPQDAERVGAIADRLAAEPVHLADGDVLTVHRFQTLGIDFGMKPGFERMHWLVENAFIRPGRLSEGFLADVLARTSSAANPLFWTLQESIYGDGANGPTAWAAQRERDRRPEFSGDLRPLPFTGEMAFPWMFEEVRLLRGFAPAVNALAERREWSPILDPDRLAANEVPVAAAVYFDDMFVDSGLQLDTLKGLGGAQAWVTNEFEHDGIGSGRVLTRLRELVRDRGGERR
ncbi:alpha/beta fold hydrolase [Glycomyces harbinensis]|uniref:Alpha/beta hydrolase fold n=1 Tax=Glycomyces harbinensis TaxID=58114 RepID=A0A1G6U7S4_9ACTN|nr:alpha/beta fold hydrolase [Glycomyces harbinensis]SDD37398.1 alpha/beta hydrolase fold [Glycomyces harbinensis]